jgi:hypothetical protein
MSEVCVHCAEEILPGDQRPATPLINGMTGEPMPEHWECALRQTIGSVAHIERRCSCYVPGSHENDPEDVSPRTAAHLAVVAWFAQEREP